MPWNTALPAAPVRVPYLDLSGGLNTKKDAHALSRNQLSISINGWYTTGNAFSKRPGNATIATGATGSGAAGRGIASGVFGGNTTLVVQQGAALYAATLAAANWGATIGSMSAAGRIRGAQIFDSGSGKDTLYLVDGKSTPQMWTGSGAIAAVATGAGKCPTNLTNAAPITPAYVATLQNSVWYAGEPTEPTGVYISDVNFPQNFTTNGFANNAGYATGQFVPMLVGHNDGVNGGAITGLEPLGPMMLVYKQSAIYRAINTGLYGTPFVWKLEVVSASVGCTSPRSIARFDTFHCFLGFDGVYMTDGMTTRRISDNVPTFFDGPNADILDRTNAVGARMGQRYLIFFDDGNGAGAGGAPAGYPTTGLWFDFAKLDEDGFPTVGQIAGMAPGGVVALRGANDDGTVAWCDATADRIGRFGVTTNSDFGNAITVTLAGKEDFFVDVFGPDAAVKPKVVNRAWLLLSIPYSTIGQSLIFTATLNLDQSAQSPVQATSLQVPAFTQGSTVGVAVVGTATVAGTANTNDFQIPVVSAQYPGFGRVVGVQVSESSTFPWTLLGYQLEVNPQEVAA